MENQAPTGISILICCYNGAQRLPRTLEHLLAQKVKPGIQWEVILLDNASTDNTQEVARCVWPDNAPAPLRIIYVPEIGKTNALYTGIFEATYEYIGVVDDDNWVIDQWVNLTTSIMKENPELGACGGLGEVALESAAPWWLNQYKDVFAIGSQGKSDDCEYVNYLYGAGMCFRKSAMIYLISHGFHPVLICRQGTQLTSGSDTEMCLAMRLAGWYLLYDSRIRFQHFQSSSRLKWDYLRRWHRGLGKSSLGLDAYYAALGEYQSAPNLKNRFGQTWQWQVFVALKQMVRHLFDFPLLWQEPPEGDHEHAWKVVWFEMKIGRLLELLRQRKQYNHSFRKIRNASWVKQPPTTSLLTS